ncbi:MAG: hypothetical protein AB7O97_22280 [Planctomycetota bacterium]
MAGALAATLAPTVGENWWFARSLARITGPHAEALSLEAVYPGITPVLAALRRDPERRVFGSLLHEGTELTGFSAAKGLPTRIMDLLYPRPLLEFAPDAVRPGDLIVVEPERELTGPYDVLVRTAYAQVLEVRG